MRDALLSVYQGLPGPVRSVAASVHGWYLSSWRYGPDAESLVEEALEREAWSLERWASWQEERLAVLLERAAKKVPFYRRQWEERRRKGDRSPIERLESWPILSKEDLRENPEAFVAEDRDIRRMYHEHTSGTSGKPLHLWRSRQAVRAWFALFEARVRRWNGVSRSDRWAMLGGQLIVSVDRDKPPYWIWNAGMKQLYMSSYHLSPDGISSYLEALRRYEIVYVLSYASSMAALAQTALERGLVAPKLRVAISNAEPLTDSQRARVSSAFQCPVRDTYGMAEIVCGASECDSGTLHLWPEAGILEVLLDDAEESAPPGEAGRLVCTGLLNPDMPLVRYAVGDRGSLSAAPQDCACGRRLPALASIEGRCDDVLITADGRRVGRLDPVFKADLPIREAQIIQEAIDRVRVKVVPVAGFDSGDANSIRHRLQQRLGVSMDVTVETVDEIPRGSAGKFRAVVSLLGREER